MGTCRSSSVYTKSRCGIGVSERALRWAADHTAPLLAIELYRQGGRFFAKQDRSLEAEEHLSGYFHHTARRVDFLQLDTRIDLVEFYVSNTEIRRASKQLILLDGQTLSEVQRIRLLGVHARLAQAEGVHEKAAALFVRREL